MLAMANGAPFEKCSKAQIQALNSQFYLLPWPYYSRVRFVAEQVAGDTGFRYRVPAGERRVAFSYGIGDQMISAGYNNLEIATTKHTNLQERFKTIAGDSVYVIGLAILPMPAAQIFSADPEEVRTRLSDAQFLAALHASLAVEISLEAGRNGFQAGIPLNIPGRAGIMGGGTQHVGSRPLNGQDPMEPFSSNGWPAMGNYFPLPEGLVWKPAGQPQSSFAVVLETQTEIDLQSGSYEDPQADVVANNNVAEVATGVQAYTFPTEIVQDFHVMLVGTTEGERQTNY